MLERRFEKNIVMKRIHLLEDCYGNFQIHKSITSHYIACLKGACLNSKPSLRISSLNESIEMAGFSCKPLPLAWVSRIPALHNILIHLGIGRNLLNSLNQFIFYFFFLEKIFFRLRGGNLWIYLLLLFFCNDKQYCKFPWAHLFLSLSYMTLQSRNGWLNILKQLFECYRVSF